MGETKNQTNLRRKPPNLCCDGTSDGMRYNKYPVLSVIKTNVPLWADVVQRFHGSLDPFGAVATTTKWGVQSSKNASDWMAI